MKFRCKYLKSDDVIQMKSSVTGAMNNQYIFVIDIFPLIRWLA